MNFMAELFDSDNENESNNSDDFEEYENDETDDDYDKIVVCKNNLIKVIRQNGDNINFEETNNLHDLDDDDEDNSEVKYFFFLKFSLIKYNCPSIFFIRIKSLIF